MSSIIKYKGQLYKRIDSDAFEEGKHDLRDLKNVLDKVYFGQIKKYLQEMSTDKEMTDKTHLYKEVLTDFEKFIPVFQKLANSLRKLPNFN